MTENSGSYYKLARTGHKVEATYARHQGKELYVRISRELLFGEDVARLAFSYQNDFEPTVTEKLLTKFPVKRLRGDDLLTHESYEHPTELAGQLTDRALIAVNLVTAEVDEHGFSYTLTEPFEGTEILAEYFAALKRRYPNTYGTMEYTI